MQSLMVNGLQLAGAAIGFLIIHYLATSPRHARFALPAALVMGAIMAAFIFDQTDPPRLFNDFRRCYWFAGELLWRGPQALATAYDPDLLVFVNLPIVAYLFAPFGLLPDMAAAIVFTLIGLGLVALVWRLLVTMYALDAREAAMLAFAFAVFGPMAYTFREGNTSHYILAMLVGGLALIRAKRGVLAGVLFGLAALIKPALLLIGVFYFLRGRWSVVLGGGATILGAVALSFLVFGWDMHVLWYETTIAPFSLGPVPAYVNQTFQGLMVRFEMGGPSNHNFRPHELAAFGRIVAWAIAFALVAGVAFAMARSRRALKPDARDVEIEFWLVVIFAMIATSLSWAHYYVWLLPGLVMLWVDSRKGAALAQLRWPAVACFVLTCGAAFISASMAVGRFGPFANLVTSHWLWGALGVFILLAIVRAQRDPAQGV